MKRVSRLWKRLGLTFPLFNVWSEEDSTFQMTDYHLKAITINRGSQDGIFGEQEHTLELNSIVNRSVRTDAPIHCDLTAGGMNRLADILGGDPENIRRRYYGRIGRQTVDDLGGDSGNAKWHTNIYASKWQAQLNNSERARYQTNNQLVVDLMRDFMDPAMQDTYYIPAPEFQSNYLQYGRVRNNKEPNESTITYSEFSRKYFDEPGFYVQNTRAGADRVLTIERRWDLALAHLDNMMPLTRSQVLAPAQWDQPNEDRPANHTVTYQNLDGEWLRKTIGPNREDERIPLVEHDLSYMAFPSTYQPTRMLEARYAQQRTDTGYRLPTVDIDLLRLITSSKYSDRKQARQLLEMEMGDPVYLSGDWVTNIRGIHFATGITEKITPDSWTVTLSLVPAVNVVGSWSPNVPARVWESARVWWDNATSDWDETFTYREGSA